MDTLTIKLASPLQSYGNQATFNYRTTYQAPSKSAILGMVAAALGYERDDERIPLLNQLAFATRIDQQGQIMTDFHTVERQSHKRTLTYRDYLQDAVFVAAIGGTTDEIKRISYALHHPKFQLYLGRRSNPPEGPLETKIMTDMDPVQALSQLKWQATEEYQKRQHTTKYHTQILADADLAPDKPVQMIKDAIGSLNPAHRFSKYRPTVELQITLTNQFIEDKPKLKKSNKNNNEILDQAGTNQDPLAAI